MDFEKPDFKKIPSQEGAAEGKDKVSSEIAPEAFENLTPDTKIAEAPPGSDWYEEQKQKILDERIDVEKVVAEAKAEAEARQEKKIISIEAARADALKKAANFESRRDAA